NLDQGGEASKLRELTMHTHQPRATSRGGVCAPYGPGNPPVLKVLAASQPVCDCTLPARLCDLAFIVRSVSALFTAASSGSLASATRVLADRARVAVRRAIGERIRRTAAPSRGLRTITSAIDPTKVSATNRSCRSRPWPSGRRREQGRQARRGA